MQSCLALRNLLNYATIIEKIQIYCTLQATGIPSNTSHLRSVALTLVGVLVEVFPNVSWGKQDAETVHAVQPSSFTHTLN